KRQIDALKRQIEERDRQLEAERAKAAQQEQALRDLERKVAAPAAPVPPAAAPPAGTAVAAQPAPPPGAPAPTTARGVRDYWQTLIESQIGAQQENSPINPLGKEIEGNVYSSDNFKVKLGASIRLHTQWNSTPVGQSVNEA